MGIEPCKKCGGVGELITTYDTEQIICKTCGWFWLHVCQG